MPRSKQAELNLSYATITAPVTGIVGKRSVNIGDRVTAGKRCSASHRPTSCG